MLYETNNYKADLLPHSRKKSCDKKHRKRFSTILFSSVLNFCNMGVVAWTLERNFISRMPLSQK